MMISFRKKPQTFLVISAASKSRSCEYEITNVLKKAYCEKHGISFIFESLDKDEEDGQKIDIVLKHLEKYDYVMWMDVDAWFNDFGVDIVDLVKEHIGASSFLIARDQHCFSDPKKWGQSYLNSGVFVVRNSEQGKRILSKWRNQSNDAILYKNELTKLNDQFYLCNLYLFDKEISRNIAVVNSFILNFSPYDNLDCVESKDVETHLNWGWYGAFVVCAARLAKFHEDKFRGMVRYSAEQNGVVLEDDCPVVDCAKKEIFDKRNSRVLVLSSGTSNLDYEYSETNPIKRKYCEKYGCDFAFYVIQSNKRSSYFNKIELCRRNMNDYDYIVWLDSDAWFNDFSIDLNEYIKKIENGASMLAEKGYSTVDKPNMWGDRYINSGVFVLKCDEAGKKIIKLWIENSCVSPAFAYLDSFSTTYDQAVLCNMLLFDEFVKNHSNVLNSLVLSSYLTKLNDDWKKAFVIHAAGIARGTKLHPIIQEALKYTKENIKQKA